MEKAKKGTFQKKFQIDKLNAIFLFSFFFFSQNTSRKVKLYTFHIPCLRKVKCINVFFIEFIKMSAGKNRISLLYVQIVELEWNNKPLIDYSLCLHPRKLFYCEKKCKVYYECTHAAITFSICYEVVIFSVIEFPFIINPRTFYYCYYFLCSIWKLKHWIDVILDYISLCFCLISMYNYWSK